MTKKQYFTTIVSIIASADVEDSVKTDITAFCEKEIAALEKKASTKRPTKQQEANAVTKDEILRTLEEADRPMTISEIMEASPAVGAETHNRVVALVTQLVKAGKVVRTVEKKKAYFSIATA